MTWIQKLRSSKRGRCQITDTRYQHLASGDSSLVVIEPMRYEDLDEVMQLERRCFSSPWSRDDFEHDLDELFLTHYIVARANGVLVGYAGLRFIAGEAHITTIAVDEKHRRKGIGRKLLEALLSEAAGRGAYSCVLEVRQSNLAAQKLYSDYGFEVTGVRRNYYDKPREDALVMTLSNVAEALRKRQTFK